MRRTELSPDQLTETIQDLVFRMVVADPLLKPAAALQRAAETVHLALDEHAIRHALREASLRCGGKDRSFLLDLLRPYDPVQALTK
jgi:hypothetical protein